MLRRGSILAAALLGAALLAAGGLAASPSEFSSTVFFRMTYRADCTFTIAIDNGPSMDSTGATAPAGATIPPGPYQVSIRTPLPDNTWDRSACLTGNISLSGPGVTYAAQLGNDLGPYSATFNVTFQPGSTYVMVDAAHPTQPVTITTTATGSSSSLLPTSATSSDTTGSSTQSDLVGSGIVPFRGSLQATVASTGAATLTAGGKPFTSVKTGRYDVVVQDHSGTSGFFLEKLGHEPEPLTGIRFQGRRVYHLNLTVGEWLFFAKNGRTTAFVVTT